ncbi:hypothetical protein Tcan_02019 [Toxocara canis]|uniref:Uncharacterized protein n=1 Tax=Toxocara canis TaxID=6265 RepID=A0A0B2VS74_TOXCA|nr:hypothetical protein Tcan_02019 [Toxocara canis]
MKPRLRLILFVAIWHIGYRDKVQKLLAVTRKRQETWDAFKAPPGSGTLSRFSFRTILIIIRKGYVCHYRTLFPPETFVEILNVLEYTHSGFDQGGIIVVAVRGVWPAGIIVGAVSDIWPTGAIVDAVCDLWQAESLLLLCVISGQVASLLVLCVISGRLA